MMDQDIMDRASVRLRKLLRALARTDGQGLSEALGPVLELVELALREEDPELLRDTAYRASRAIDNCGSSTIGRDIERRSLDEFLDQALRPVSERIAREGADVPEALLFIRDLRLALAGQRRLGSVRNDWGLVPADRASWSDRPEDAVMEADSVARELQRDARVRVRVVTDPEELRRCRGIILPAALKGRALFLAGLAAGARIPAVVADRTLSPNACGMPVVGDAGQALALLRREADSGPVAVTEAQLHGEAVLALSEALQGLESEDLRDSVERHYDRQAARDVEIIRLIREHGLEKPFFDIYANGSREGFSAEYAQRLNGARHVIEELRRQLQTSSDAGGPEP